MEIEGEKIGVLVLLRAKEKAESLVYGSKSGVFESFFFVWLFVQLRDKREPREYKKFGGVFG